MDQQGSGTTKGDEHIFRGAQRVQRDGALEINFAGDVLDGLLPGKAFADGGVHRAQVVGANDEDILFPQAFL